MQRLTLKLVKAMILGVHLFSEKVNCSLCLGHPHLERDDGLGCWLHLIYKEQKEDIIRNVCTSLYLTRHLTSYWNCFYVTTIIDSTSELPWTWMNDKPRQKVVLVIAVALIYVNMFMPYFHLKARSQQNYSIYNIFVILIRNGIFNISHWM